MISLVTTIQEFIEHQVDALREALEFRIVIGVASISTLQLLSWVVESYISQLVSALPD